MTEIGEHWHQREQNVAGEPEREDVQPPDGPFLAFAQAFQQENERLIQLADACREHAGQLTEREENLAERERRVWEVEEQLAQRQSALDLREQHLNQLAARAEEVDARLAEATEHERALAALGLQIVERYQASHEAPSA